MRGDWAMTSTPAGRTRTGVLLARLIALLRGIPLVGTALQWYARRYPEGSMVTIRSGYARGLKWRRHHRYVSGYWLGQYELAVQAALVRELRPGAVFFDVGANAGFFTLLAARQVGPTGRSVAFDPDPENVSSILEQARLNGLSSVRAVQEAITDVVGRARFAIARPGEPTGHLWDGKSAEASSEVVTTTLDAAAARYGAPDLVKLDIEGGEGRALRGATTLLGERRAAWLIELHGPDSLADVRNTFDAAGYDLCFLTGEGLKASGVLPTHVLVRPHQPRPVRSPGRSDRQVG